MNATKFAATSSTILSAIAAMIIAAVTVFAPAAAWAAGTVPSPAMSANSGSGARTAPATPAGAPKTLPIAAAPAAAPAAPAAVPAAPAAVPVAPAAAPPAPAAAPPAPAAVPTAPAAAPPTASPAPAPTSASPAAAPSPAAKKNLFKGIVQDDKLQPLAGATATVVSLAKREEPEAPRDGPVPGRAPRRGPRMPPRERVDDAAPPVFFTGTTDATGLFSVEAEGEGPFNLRIEAPGFAPVTLEAVKPGDAVSTLFLRKGVAAAAVVADLETGAPVSDAEVAAVAEEDLGFRDPDDPKRFAALARTGRDGSVTVQDLAPGFYSFRVHAAGKASFEAGGKPVGDAAARTMTFYLEPGFDISGRVLDPAGKPVPRIDVRARPARGGGAVLRMLTRGSYAPVSARTDKEGRFTLRGLPAEGKFTVDIAGGDYAPASVEIPHGRPGVAVAGIEIKLEKPVILRGKLMDAEQKPVAKGVSAALTYRDPKTRRYLREVTREGKAVQFSPTGEMTIGRLPSGLATVTLSVEGFKDVERKDVQVGGGERPSDLGTIVLDRGKKIAGRVVDDAAKPIASARISGSSFAPGRGAFRSAETKTDATGVFALGGLDEDPMTVEASARGYSTARQQDVTPGGEPIELTLARAGSVKGRVLLGDPPKPVVNFRVEATPKETGGGFGGFRFMAGGGGDSRNQSDARGQFTLSDLSPGSYTVICRAEGLQDLVRDGVEVRAGETADIGDLTLEAGGTIRGRVVSKPEGLPVAGAAVRVKASGLFDFRSMMAGREGAVLSDLGGHFELRGLPSGPTTITVEPVNYAKIEVPGIAVEVGRETEEVTVSVGKGGRIEGVVLGSDGRPRQGAMVTAMSGIADFSAQLTATTDEQGRYAIENIAPGTVRVACLPSFDDDAEDGGGPGGGRGFGGIDSITADVKDGEATTVNFGEKKIAVSGSLKRKAGETAKQMVMFIPGGVGAGGRAGLQTATTDEAGHYEITLKTPGDYDVYVGDQGMRGGTALKATIPDKPVVSYDIVVPEGAISGRVTDENGGKPLKGAMVVVSASLGKDERPSIASRRGGSRATTGEDGTYSVDGLAAGKYDVSYVLDGYGTETVQGIEVKGTDERSSLDQVLRAGVPFKVRVAGPNGAGVSGALVMVSQGGTILQGVAGMTREDGYVELKQLKAGVYSFFALTRDQAPGIVREIPIGGEKDGDTAIVSLTPGGSARILVQDYGKKPVSGASISCESADGADLDQALQLFTLMRGGQTSTGGDGALLLEHLPAGKYQVTVASKDKKITKSLTVEDGAKAELAITLE